MKDVVRYSEAFGLRLAGDVASGKYANLEDARRRNGIRGGPGWASEWASVRQALNMARKNFT
ncbi:MAG: hypothetical protein LBO04_02980 [Spirochaetaceae bacterium]|jgi:hypothetical protein|nr:hypothetical protein [Spirochaetaceae bacterium]